MDSYRILANVTKRKQRHVKKNHCVSQVTKTTTCQIVLPKNILKSANQKLLHGILNKSIASPVTF